MNELVRSGNNTTQFQTENTFFISGFNRYALVYQNVDSSMKEQIDLTRTPLMRASKHHTRAPKKHQVFNNSKLYSRTFYYSISGNPFKAHPGPALSVKSVDHQLLQMILYVIFVKFESNPYI